MFGARLRTEQSAHCVNYWLISTQIRRRELGLSYNPTLAYFTSWTSLLISCTHSAMIKQRCNDHWLLIGLNYLIKTAFEKLEIISVYIPSLWCVMGTLTFSFHATNTNWVLSLAAFKNKSSSLTFASLSGKNLSVDSPLWQCVIQPKMSSHVVSLLTLAAKYPPKKGRDLFIYAFIAFAAPRTLKFEHAGLERSCNQARVPFSQHWLFFSYGSEWICDQRPAGSPQLESQTQSPSVQKRSAPWHLLIEVMNYNHF